MNPKIVTMWARQGRRRTTHCEAPDCKRATREGKPFCTEHVASSNYVRNLLASMAAREAEEASVRGAEAADPFGPSAREILITLWVNGERTVARLARELNIEFPVVQEFVQALVKAELITLRPTRRGAGKAKLIPRLEALEDPRDLRYLRPAQPLVFTELPSQQAAG